MKDELMAIYKAHEIRKVTIGQRTYVYVRPLDESELYYPDSEDVKSCYDHDFDSVRQARIWLKRFF